MNITPDDMISFFKTIAVPTLTFLSGAYKDVIKSKLGFQKEKQQIESAENDGIKAYYENYKELLDDLREQYSKQIENQKESFKLSLDTLKSDVAELQGLNETLMEVIEMQKKQIKQYKEELSKNK